MMRNLVTVGLLAASCGVGSEGAAGGGSAPNLLSPSETRDQKLDGWIVGPDGSLRSRISSASIDAQLPPTSTGRVHLAVRGTSVRIGFRPLGIADRPAGHDGGQIVYKNVAAGSAELRYRVVAGAVEDVMVFNEQPRQREVRYEVDVSAVSGLRLVAGTLEYLDSG